MKFSLVMATIAFSTLASAACPNLAGVYNKCVLNLGKNIQAPDMSAPTQVIINQSVTKTGINIYTFIATDSEGTYVNNAIADGVKKIGVDVTVGHVSKLNNSTDKSVCQDGKLITETEIHEEENGVKIDGKFSNVFSINKNGELVVSSGVNPDSDIEIVCSK